jgi:glycine/D-amino acid oxidase-like deaminating enzyme
MEEALAHDPGEPCPPLSGDTSADVVVVGGGYTGMWAAEFLKQVDPGIDVVLLEQDICGGGPSGRNGGFVNGLWDDLGLLIERYGPEGGMAVARAAGQEIDGIGAWCQEHRVDAWYAKDGDLGISASPAQDAVLDSVIREAAETGIGELYQRLSADEARAHCASPLLRGAVWIPDAAKVQPARLARGLRRVLLDRGVRIHEGTPVRRFHAGPRIVAETPGGTVTAGHAVLAVNAWGMHWRAFRRAVMVRGTFIVITEPAPERLAELGWTGGEGLYDFRTALHYLRTTPDGRIAFGGAGGSGPASSTRSARSAAWLRTSTGGSRPSGPCPSRPPGAVPSTSPAATCRSSAPCPMGARTSRWASRATAWDRPGWRAGSSPRSPPSGQTPSRRCRSSTTGRRRSRRTRCSCRASGW